MKIIDKSHIDDKRIYYLLIVEIKNNASWMEGVIPKIPSL